MSKFTKGQRILFITKDGHRRFATIDAVGATMLGVFVDIMGTRDYTAISMSQVIKSPAQTMGIEVGDEVEILRSKALRGLSGRTFLHEDDLSTSPRFRDEHGNKHYVTLTDVKALPQGPTRHTKWSDAPVGATHYSLTSHHGSKWHKLDETGQWHFAISDSNKTTSYIKYGNQRDAEASNQVAIPGVVVAVNPLHAVAAEVVALETTVRSKMSEVESLTREVTRLNLDKQRKLDAIKAAGFKVENGKLEALPVSKPVSEWKAGDKVKCISTYMCGMAELTVGKIYEVADRYGVICVRDDAGDRMGDCVKAGCFVWQEAGEDLAQVHVSQWRKGDTVRNVNDQDRGYGDLKIGMEYVLLDDGCVSIRDAAGDRRHRSASDYVLVKRA